MKNKNQNNYRKVFLLYLAVNLVFFSITYFAIRPLRFLLDQSVFLAIPVAISFLLSLKLYKNLKERILFAVFASIASIFMGFLLVLSALYLPGSRAHDHIMYDVCIPAMKRHYGLNENEPWPSDNRIDKEGFGIWWYQHLECEENVRNGKGPVFSENPAGFIPVKK